MLTLKEAAAAIGATTRGQDATFSAVTTDSRKVVKGDLFIALSGEHFNAHDFVSQAIAQGAAAALVATSEADKRAAEWNDLPLILADDTRLALGKLASFWRGQQNIRLVAVTGSNGKTTVKECSLPSCAMQPARMACWRPKGTSTTISACLLPC